MGATSLFSKFAKLLDRTTVDLPTLNTPLADALAAKADSSSLSYVALSGSYDDLIDVPSPSPGVSEVADLTDATTYAFPTLNTPLVNALAGKSATGHNHAGVYDPAGSAAAAQAAAIQRANHTGAQAISTVTGLQTAIDGKSSTAHTHSNAEVNTAIAASPATSATAMGLGTGNTATFAGLNVAGLVYQTGLGESTYFGDQAGANDDLTTNNNTGVGYQALKATTTGAYNVASGAYSLNNNTLGSKNVASGAYSLRSNTIGSYNVASGVDSLRSNTSGTNNVASGVDSLRSNTSGTNNVASGSNSLFANTTGNYNVASGSDSLFANTTGNYNVASGSFSLYSNTSGTYNTANGLTSLYSNTTGGYNTANGAYSLNSNITGERNTATGYTSLHENTTGSNNAAFGYRAGRYITGGATANTTSGSSIYLGADTKALASGDTNEIVIGYDATGAGSNTVTLGNASIAKTVLKGNVGIGTSLPVSRTSIQIPSTSGIGIALNLNNPGAYGVGQGSKSVGIRFSRSPNDAGSTGIMADIYAGNSVESTSSNGFLAFATRTGVSEVTTERLRIDSSGNVGIGTDAPSEKLDVVGNIKASGVIKKGVLTVGTLPGSPTAGMSSYVTDSSQTLAAGIGTTLVAGGANFTPVHYNGTNWIIG